MNYNVILPKTKLPLKRKPNSEPKVLPEVHTNSGSFLLHDGPIYSNGNLHIGHFLNKTLKDFINRKQKNGFNFIIGSDKHGLPVEVLVEEQYKKSGKDKSDIVQFRKDCHEFATNWSNIQKDQLKSFGILANWDETYQTDSRDYQTHILSNLYALKDKGLIEQRFKPIWWSAAEKTTLAEAELEYSDISVDTLFVEFPTVNKDFSVLVWTTTGWTLIGNKSVAFNNDIDYVIVTDGNKKFIVSKSFSENNDYNLVYVRDVDNDELNDVQYYTPFDSTLKTINHADFVNDKVGTGFVHIVPGHGYDDFEYGVEHNLDLSPIVDDAAMIHYEGNSFHIYKGDEFVISLLNNLDYFFKVDKRTLKREISWRSKKPLIVKTKLNWFFKIEDVVPKIVDEVNNNKVIFEPLGSKNRFLSMISNRKDWCISRQRSWGVPLAFFVDKESGELLNDKKVDQNILNIFKEHGSDIWYEKETDYFLSERYHNKYEKVIDVLDVWFDSGSSLKAVHSDVDSADIYLEGNDQHKGFFQTSSLIHYALHGCLPFKKVITHGFVTHGKDKISKSENNSNMKMDDLMTKYGPDVLRFWALSSSTNYADVELTKENLDRSEMAYNKIRNTLRFLVSNMTNEVTDVTLRDIDILFIEDSKLMLDHCMNEDNYVSDLHEYCVRLSNTYFNMIKDSLYCDSIDNDCRKSIILTINSLFANLMEMIYPVFPFLHNEIMEVGYVSSSLDIDYIVPDSDLGKICNHIENVKGEFESFRKEHNVTIEDVEIGYPVDIDLVTYLSCAGTYHSENIEFKVSDNEKCPRCRTRKELVDTLCERCHDVENKLKN